MESENEALVMKGCTTFSRSFALKARLGHGLRWWQYHWTSALLVTISHNVDLGQKQSHSQMMSQQ